MKKLGWRLIGIGFLGALAPAHAGAADAKTGASLFNSRACVSCHAIGSMGSATTGPNLAGVTARRSVAWLARWIKSPDQMKEDPVVKGLKAKYALDMPNLGLSDDEVQSLIDFLKEKGGP